MLIFFLARTIWNFIQLNIEYWLKACGPLRVRVRGSLDGERVTCVLSYVRVRTSSCRLGRSLETAPKTWNKRGIQIQHNARNALKV